MASSRKDSSPQGYLFSASGHTASRPARQLYQAFLPLGKRPVPVAIVVPLDPSCFCSSHRSHSAAPPKYPHRTTCPGLLPGSPPKGDTLQDRCCLSICHLVTQPLPFACFDKTLEALVGLELPRQLRVTLNPSPSVSATECCHYRNELPHPAGFAFV